MSEQDTLRQSAIESLERLSAINATMALYATQRGDALGAIEFRRESSRLSTMIAEIGKQHTSPPTPPTDEIL